MRLVEESRSLMGTVVTIKILHESVEEGREILARAFREIARIEASLSRFTEHNEVGVLNRYGFLPRTSEDLVAILRRAVYFSKLTGGAFDVTVLPLIELWEKSLENGREPSDDEVQVIVKQGGYRNLQVRGSSVKIKSNLLKVDLGGLAKGYAVDRAIDVLKEAGVKSGLVNAGGDVRVLGQDGVEPWRVAVRDPFKKSTWITVLCLRDKAVATSGTYERFIARSKRFPHIIDPRTGKPVASGIVSVTVLAERCIDADALATSALVLGLEDAQRVLRKAHAHGFFVMGDGSVFRTSGFSSYECPV